MEALLSVPLPPQLQTLSFAQKVAQFYGGSIDIQEYNPEQQYNAGNVTLYSGKPYAVSPDYTNPVHTCPAEGYPWLMIADAIPYDFDAYEPYNRNDYGYIVPEEALTVFEVRNAGERRLKYAYGIPEVHLTTDTPLSTLPRTNPDTPRIRRFDYAYQVTMLWVSHASALVACNLEDHKSRAAFIAIAALFSVAVGAVERRRLDPGREYVPFTLNAQVLFLLGILFQSPIVFMFPIWTFVLIAHGNFTRSLAAQEAAQARLTHSSDQKAIPAPLPGRMYRAWRRNRKMIPAITEIIGPEVRYRWEFTGRPRTAWEALKRFVAGITVATALQDRKGLLQGYWFDLADGPNPFKDAKMIYSVDKELEYILRSHDRLIRICAGLKPWKEPVRVTELLRYRLVKYCFGLW